MTRLLVTTYNIEDALTGEVIEGGFMTEKFAEKRCEKIKRKHSAAFVKKVEQ